MPINRRIRPCPTACGVLHWVCRLWLAVVLWSCMHTGHTAHDAAPQNHSLHTQAEHRMQ